MSDTTFSSRLDIKFNFVANTLEVLDESPYERWKDDGDLDEDSKHAVIQRLVFIKNGEGNSVFKEYCYVAETIDDLSDPWEVKDLKNGLYYYQKVVLPTETHVPSGDYPYMWYDTSSKKVKYQEIQDGPEKTLDPSEDFDEIYSYVLLNTLDNCFFFDDYTFNIYSLVQCYLLNERARINNFLKNNCWGGCSGTKDLDTKSDILLAAIAVLSDLIEKGEFFEAQRILDNLNTCGHLCKDFKETLKGCGCGKD